MQHPDEGTIHAWLDDALPSDEAARIALHVESCAECAERVAEARGLIAGASRIVGALDGVAAADVLPKFAPPHPRPARPAWRRPRWFIVPSAIAATLFVAAGSLLVTRHVRDDGVRNASSRVTTTAVPMPTSPTEREPRRDSTANSRPPVPSAAAPGVVASSARQKSATTASTTATPRPTLPPVAAVQGKIAEAAPPRVDSSILRPHKRIPAQTQLTEVVTTGVSAAAPARAEPSYGAAAAARADVAAKTRAAAAAAAPAARAPGVAIPTALQDAARCYQAFVDKVDTTGALRDVPSRLVLTRTPVADSASAQYVVAVTRENGAVEAVSNAYWRAFGMRGVLTWLAPAETLSMNFNLSGDARAWLGTASGPAVAVVVRAAACR